MKSINSKTLKPVSPTANVVVSVKTKYSQHISKIMALASIQNGASVDPADAVNIVGTVVSVPLQIPKYHDYKGFTTEHIKEGDTVLFSYKVIYDMKDTETDEPKFRNRMWYGDKEYFMADIRKIFGVIRGEDIVMLNGYVMTTQFEESRIILPQHMRKIKHAARAQVMHIGHPKSGVPSIDAEMGDWVYFNPFKAQKYTINEKKFCILNQDQILGKDAVK